MFPNVGRTTHVRAIWCFLRLNWCLIFKCFPAYVADGFFGHGPKKRREILSQIQTCLGCKAPLTTLVIGSMLPVLVLSLLCNWTIMYNKILNRSVRLSFDLWKLIDLRKKNGCWAWARAEVGAGAVYRMKLEPCDEKRARRSQIYALEKDKLRSRIRSSFTFTTVPPWKKTFLKWIRVDVCIWWLLVMRFVIT